VKKFYTENSCMQLKTVTIHFTITGERWGTPIRCKLFLCIYANTHLFVFLARLCIANNIPDDNISQVDSQRVLHSTTSAAPEASPEALMYSTPTGFYAGQSPSPKLIPVKPPPRPVQPTTLSSQMVMVPDQPLPLSVVPI
jgi:hypothetical protein